MSWLLRNKRWVVLITTALASVPFLPEGVRMLLSIGSQVLGSGDLPQ